MTNPADGSHVPFITTAQMIEVDRAMVEDYGIDMIQMMEMAGRSLADLARRRFLQGDAAGRRVVILAGTGGNGGGALVAARHLHNWGAVVEVFVTAPPRRFAGVPGRQMAIVERLGIPTGMADDLEVGTEQRDLVVGDAPASTGSEPAIILDGVIGYSLRGAPRGPAARLINWANSASTPILSLDVPSGVDSTTGVVFDPAIKAAATLTLALPKVGLGNPNVASNVGELYLADIGVPPELYESDHIGVHAGRIFHGGDIVRLV